MIKAQTNVYHPFPDSAACWKETYTWGTTCVYQEKRNYIMSGDTVIGSNTYHRLMRSSVTTCNFSNAVYSSGREYIRQDVLQKKVYAFKNNQEFVLYDFNLPVGAASPTLQPSSSYMSYTITAIDSVLINGSYRKRWTTSESFGAGQNGSAPITIIEGVGSTSHLFFYSYGQGIESGTILNAMMQNGQCIYVDPNSVCSCQLNVGIEEFNLSNGYRVSPNPAADKLTMEANIPLGNVQLLDALGNILYSAKLDGSTHSIDLKGLTAGIYILKTPAGIKKIVKE